MRLLLRWCRPNTAADNIIPVPQYMDEDLAMPPTSCDKPLNMKDFWKDMQWLNVPEERQTTFIEPSYPRGLLGGNPDGPPKMSKLQALAAARKKKVEDAKKASSSDDVAKPMANLTLSNTANTERLPSTSSSRTESPPAPTLKKENLRSHSGLKRKDSSPHSKTLRPSTPVQSAAPITPPLHEPRAETAAPSAFAMTMFGGGMHSSRHVSAATFSLSYGDILIQSADAFSGPSPDDVVKAAQSKGAAARNGHL